MSALDNTKKRRMALTAILLFVYDGKQVPLLSGYSIVNSFVCSVPRVPLL